MHLFLRIFGWAMAVVLYGAGGLMLLLFGLSLLTPWAGWVMIPAVVLVWIGVVMRLRRRRATALLVFIEQAVRLNMPLSHMLEAQSVSEIGTLGRRMSHLAGYLNRGMTVGHAIEAGAPEVPARLRDVIVAGERVGRLPQALKHAVSQRRAQDDAEPASEVLLWGYPIAVISTMFVLLMGILLFIIPKFIVIFEDFDAEMPGLTVLVVEFAKWLGGPMLGLFGASQYNEYQLVPGLVWVLLLIVACIALWAGVKVGVLRPLWDRVAWHLPWAKRRALADACQIIEQGLYAGLPTSAAAQSAGEARLNAVLGHRLKSWSAALEQGQPIGDAARHARLPAVWSQMTAAAQTTGNLPDVFGFLRRHYTAGVEQWVAAMRSVMATLTILCLASITGVVVLGMLLPLAELIWATVPESLGGGLTP